jgi:hypothetical protein
LEDKEAQLELLLGKMLNEPRPACIRQTLNELKAYGMPLPDDLVEFERDLEAEFAANNVDQARRARIDRVIAKRARR